MPMFNIRLTVSRLTAEWLKFLLSLHLINLCPCQVCELIPEMILPKTSACSSSLLSSSVILPVAELQQVVAWFQLPFRSPVPCRQPSGSFAGRKVS